MPNIYNNVNNAVSSGISSLWGSAPASAPPKKPAGTTNTAGPMSTNSTAGPMSKNAFFPTPSGAPVAGQSFNKPKPSTTVLSNSNKINQVPKMNAQLNTFSNKGVVSNPQTGVAVYADGSSAPVPASTPKPLPKPAYEEETKNDTALEEKQTNDLLESMKANLDASTKGMIDNIQQKFAQRKAEQADINMRQNKGMTNALLMGGATGSGSSAQYAPISSEGIIGAQESFGIRQLANIDSQEQDAIAGARAAQEAGNYKLMETKLGLVEKKRAEKIAHTEKLNEKIQARNDKLREESKMIEEDSHIADLYSQGVQDPTSIMESLREKGIPLTAKRVNETLEMIGKNQNRMKLEQDIITNGAPSEIQNAVLNAKSQSDIMRIPGIANYLKSPLDKLQEQQAKMNIQKTGMDIKKMQNELLEGSATPGITAKDREKLLGDTTVKQTAGNISVLNLLKNYKEMVEVGASHFMGAKEIASLNAYVMNVIGPAQAVANGQGALSKEEQENLMTQLGVKGIGKRESVTLNNIDKIIGGTKTKIQGGIDTVESAYPGVKQGFQLFSDYDAKENAIPTMKTFYNSSPEHKQLLDSVHAQFPNATDIEVYQMLKSKGLI